MAHNVHTCNKLINTIYDTLRHNDALILMRLWDVPIHIEVSCRFWHLISQARSGRQGKHILTFTNTLKERGRMIECGGDVGVSCSSLLMWTDL
jgi:hypothetical protein